MKALVGYTGFVGQNLLAAETFDALYNSKNITDAFGTKPDALYFCGIGAQKFLANTDPTADMAVVQTAMDNIARIAPQKLVLISTVDVYDNPAGVEEDTHINEHALHPYGLHRLKLEQWARSQYPDVLVVRLPGLYGQGLKKNFLFDLITVLPAMITGQKMQELDAELLARYYTDAKSGFYKLNEDIDPVSRSMLKDYFTGAGFTALDFTDSRAVFQFYNLRYLAGHIRQALELKIELLNVTAEPVAASVLYSDIYGGEEWANHLPKEPPYYDSRSKWAADLGGADGYLFDRAFVLKDVRAFVLDAIERGTLR